MFQQRYASARAGQNRNNRSFPRQRGFGSRGRGQMKTFNPHQLINTVKATVVMPQATITHSFSDFNFSPELAQNITKHGYTTLTPIQDQAIQPIMEGRDVIGIANTGTGKTAAFLLPLIEKVLKNRNEKILIVSPTRELASQINDEFRAFARGLGIYSVLCIGGTNMFRQYDDLRRSFSLIIGTPGRLKDLIESRRLNVSEFQSVVLDEADHMLDIGFITDIKFLISCLHKERQSLFFSATIDERVREVLQMFVKNPVTISVKTGTTAENVEQTTVKVSTTDKKIDQLHDMLIQKEFEKVLIFGRTKWGVQKLSDELVRRGFRADAIHGNKRQGQRLRTLSDFKNDRIQILLATDVAARGLDIPNVSHVINYDLPDTQDAYIHRIGRTGRADKKGIALTFVE